VFVDRVQFEVAAGNGGRGICSFRREKYVPRGGPDGGDGGDGGSVIIRAQAGVDSLAALAHRQQWRAESGVAGGPANCQGARGDDLTLLVPPGTLIIDQATGLVLKDGPRRQGGAGQRPLQVVDQPGAPRGHPR